MHPLTAAALLDRLQHSTPVKSSQDAAQDALSFTDSTARLATPNARVYFGWPELPMRKQEIYIIPEDASRVEDGNEGDLDEYRGGFQIVVFDPRAQRCLLTQEAIRRDLNRSNTAWPNPSSFGAGPTTVRLERFKVTKIHGLVPPSPEDGYETFRGAVSGVTTERVEEG